MLRPSDMTAYLSLQYRIIGELNLLQSNLSMLVKKSMLFNKVCIMTFPTKSGAASIGALLIPGIMKSGDEDEE